MNTIAATTNRIPRVAVIGLVVLVAAFAALMLVRTGVIGGSSTESVAVPATQTPKVTHRQAAKPAVPTVVLLPGLPVKVAHALRYSKVVVVSLYVGPAAGDRPAVAQARAGARQAGAGFVAVNAVDDRFARELTPFVGVTSSPAMLIVKRPGTIVTRMQGQFDSTVVAQAAHNAGARRG